MFQTHIARSVNSPVAGFQEVVNVDSSFGVVPDAGGLQTRSALNLEIFCRCFSLVGDFLIFDNLPFIEAAETGFLDGRDMDKHIFSTTLRLNKSIPFLGIEPLHGAA
jgi:hypothetical protein